MRYLCKKGGHSIMYGEVTGKVVLFAFIIIFALLSLTRTFFLLSNTDNKQYFSLKLVVRILMPLVLVYIAWHLLWH